MLKGVIGKVVSSGHVGWCSMLGHFKHALRAVLGSFCLLLAFATPASAQDNQPGQVVIDFEQENNFSDGGGGGPAIPDFEEANLSVELSTALQAQGEGIVGDSTSLADGSLSFAHTDVSLPGNSGLPVAFTRSYSVNGVSYFGSVLGGWHLDVPMITTRARTTLVVGGSRLSGWHDNRCSGDMRPRIYDRSNSEGRRLDDRAWGGVRMFMPGQGGQLILQDAEGPASLYGGTKPVKTTADHWKFECNNATDTEGNAAGDGFTGIAPDGTRYEFNLLYEIRAGNWRISRPDEGCTNDFCEDDSDELEIDASHYILLATKITDVNGNTVNYNYDGSNGTGRLQSITSNDGREITIESVSYTHLTLPTKRIV